MGRNDYRYKTIQLCDGVTIDLFTLHDKTKNYAIRHFKRLTYANMINILGDALYEDSDNFDVRISEDNTVSVITVNENIKYSSMCYEITVSDDGYFRKYKKFAITFNDGKMYIADSEGRLLRIEIANPIDDIDAAFDAVYDIIDDIDKNNKNY